MRILSSLFIGLVASYSAFSSAAQWKLEEQNSQLNFISIKNSSIAEVHDFTSLSGKIDDNGNAKFTVNLTSVETNIGIRNERMNEHLFESKKYPVASFSTKIDSQQLDTLSIGESTMVTLSGSLNLHGVEQPITTDVNVVKSSDKTITVSTLKPIIVDAKAFNLEAGVNQLKTLAGLANISFAVPVTFTLQFSH